MNNCYFWAFTMCFCQVHYVFLTIISMLTTCLCVGCYFHCRQKQMKTKEGKKLAPDTKELTVQDLRWASLFYSPRADRLRSSSQGLSVKKAVATKHQHRQGEKNSGGTAIRWPAGPHFQLKKWNEGWRRGGTCWKMAQRITTGEPGRSKKKKKISTDRRRKSRRINLSIKFFLMGISGRTMSF